MSGEVVVALITLLGSAIGTIGGIFATNKMTAYRIEQLEKKVDKHKLKECTRQKKIFLLFRKKSKM